MVAVQWQVDEGRGRWRDFPAGLNTQTEEAFAQNPTALLSYVWPNQQRDKLTDYVLDFVDCTQRNCSTGAIRQIRRVLLCPGPVQALQESLAIVVLSE